MHHTVLVLSRTRRARFTFARISCAVLVHTKGCGLSMALGDVRVNRRNQLWDTAKHAATKLFGRQVAKDAFDQIEPGTPGRREVHLDARVARPPPLDCGVFMRGIIVGDQIQGRALGNLAVNETEEPEPFLVPMARQTGGEERALGHIQGGKGRGRAMAFVLVRHRAAAPGLEKQAWLGRSGACLDLALLIHTQDHGMLGRGQTEAHHSL